MKKPLRLSKFLIFLFLIGCGYHFQERSSQDRLTISIPSVTGDSEGMLTNELVRALSNSSVFYYAKEKRADAILNVAITSSGNESIGYRYDRKPASGKLRKNLVPTESRRILTAEIVLIDAITKEPLLGPTTVQANVDLDYVDSSSIRDLSFINPEGKRETVIQFSLGQLDSIEGAQDTARTPLFRDLAQKIVEGLMHGLK